MTLRAALVGCGMISEFHLRGWRNLPQVEVVALCDRDEAAARARAQAFVPTARIYRDLQALLQAEDIHFLDVASPPSAHVEHCQMALHAGRHVVCQKPLAPSSLEALTLCAHAQQKGLALAVHENHRLRPWFTQVLQHHREGRFGRIVRVRWQQWDAGAPPEAYKRAAGHGVLFEYGTHLLDMMLTLLGAPTSVAARLAHLHGDVVGDSYAHAIFDYGEALADIDVAWKPSGPASGSFHLLGERGEALFEGIMTRGLSSRFRLVCDGEVLIDDQRDPLRDYADSFCSFQSAFVQALTQWPTAPLPVSGAEAARVLQVMEAAYDAAAAKRTLAVNFL